MSKAPAPAVSTKSTAEASLCHEREITNTGGALHAQLSAAGYTGWGPWRSRTTTNRSEYGSSSVGVGDDDVQLLAQRLCAADFAVESQAFTTERRANGWVRASAIFWTCDDCLLSGRHRAWAQKYVWYHLEGRRRSTSRFATAQAA